MSDAFDKMLGMIEKASGKAVDGIKETVNLEYLDPELEAVMRMDKKQMNKLHRQHGDEQMLGFGAHIANKLLREQEERKRK